MKKVMLVIIIATILATIGFLGFNYFSNSDSFFVSDGLISDAEAEQAFNLLNNSLSNPRYTYFEYINEFDVTYGDNEFFAKVPSEEVATIDYEDSLLYEINVEKAGLYHLNLTYKTDDTVLNNATISLKLNGNTPFAEASTIDLPMLWKDKSKEFSLDSYGDEALPLQVKLADWYNVDLYNNLYYTVNPLMFYFEEGMNTIEIENVSSSNLEMGMLKVYEPIKLLDYETYKKDHTGTLIDSMIEINATEYTEKNSSYIRLFSYNNPTGTPFDPVDKMLNIITGGSWYDPGKKVSFEFDVEETGLYKFAIHHLPGKEDFQTFRTLRIDGNVPFSEMKAFPLEETKSTRFTYETLSNAESEPFEFYLTKGHHELSLTADYEPVSEDVRLIQLVIDHINEFSLDIRKITGKDVDKNRTWKLTEYLPETQQYLEAYDLLIKYVIQETSQFAPNGDKSSTLSYLQKALVKLDKMLIKPDELPLYFEDLYSGSGSVNQMLGDSMEMLTEQPLALNEMTFYGDDLNKKDNASFLKKQISGFKTFISSFTSGKYVVRNDEEVLNVWVNRPITHVDTLQKLVDAEFTKETGIEVKISVMPDANKLVLASAGGESPDVAMGLLSYMPFDLAIRGAAYDLTSFDDFWEVADRFTPGGFIPYVLEDNVYALPETLEFFTTVYRKDVFESLGLDVPNTWQEVTELLPELQRYGKNFFHPIAGGTSLKWFFQTSPFIYQNDGVLYSDDGLRTTIDSPEAVAGLEYLTKLFTMFSLPEQEPLFYNSFRDGTLPIGIADFTTYMQIKNAAPELVGRWALAPYPGTEDENGDIKRWYIANGRGSVIMEDTKKADEAWTFLKWWTSENVQTTYSYTLQSIYGPEYLWLSSNLESVKNSPIDMQDKIVILEQIKWLRDVPRTPGQYMLERGLSDIWNKAVFDGMPTRIAIDRQIITINREIKKKMIEFGYLDKNGEVLKPYTVRDIDWLIEQIETKGKGYDD